jgi:hypothetical protein
MIYELMDVESANLIGTYDSESAALAVVRAAIQAHGRACVASLALGCEDDDGNGALIAEGTDLAARALAAKSSEPHRSNLSS